MGGKQKTAIAIGILAIAAVIVYFTGGASLLGMGKKPVKKIELENNGQTKQEALPIANSGPVSPISGLACDNWNRRPIAAMQPSDVTARPAAGFSEADMVFELPAFTSSVTRLMGVYLCNLPTEMAALRSARHDYVHLAAGLDAIFVHWGYSRFAETLLNEKKVIDNVNCLSSSYCDRNQALIAAGSRTEDTGRLTQENALKMLNESGYRKEGKFSGYLHQGELPADQRPKGGHIRVAFAAPYDVEYDYDPQNNNYLRSWDNKPDTDRNNGQRIAPKNVVVMFAKSEQIRLADEQKYIDAGVTDPWSLVPEADRKGIDDIPGAVGIGRYNNVQLGDPWFDTTDSGEAYFYMNGQQIHGTWKKPKNDIASKLSFYDGSGQEIKFVPGQIWVDILEPGQNLNWEPVQ